MQTAYTYIHTHKQASFATHQGSERILILQCACTSPTSHFLSLTQRVISSHLYSLLYKCALPSNFRRFLSAFSCLFSSVASSGDSFAGDCLLLSLAAACSNSWAPRVSVSRRTRVLTVAPSRLFLPSRRLAAIFSVKSHSRPEASSAPVSGSRGAAHSDARRRRGGTLASFDLIV